MCRREQFTVVIGSPPVYGSIIFELALQLCFIYWTFLCTSQETHWYSLSFSWLDFVFSEVVSIITTRYSVFNHCCFNLVNTFMYILRPKHLQIQVTHGTHTCSIAVRQKHRQKNNKILFFFLFFYEWPFFSTFLLKCEYGSNHNCRWLTCKVFKWTISNTHFYSYYTIILKNVFHQWL